MSKELAPLDTIGIAAKLEDRGLSVGVKSRFTTAVDRLLGRYVDLLLAPVDGLEARIRARDAKKLEAIEADIALIDRPEELVERRVLIDSARKQDNVSAVVREALEGLADDGAPGPGGADSGADVDEDWLNIFKNYAETASSERMRTLWGRVLAGELRAPGVYSYSTLRFISELDPSIAKKTELAFSKVVGNWILFPEEMSGDVFLLHSILEQRGLISGFEGMQNVLVNIGEDGRGFLRGNTHILQINGVTGSKITTSVMFLTEVGREVLPLLPQPDEVPLLREVVERMDKSNITKITLGKILSPDRMSLDEVLFEKSE